MSEIDTALAEMVTLVKTLPLTESLGTRVWAHPGESTSIDIDTLPVAIVSKMNAEPGSWKSMAFGEGVHRWKILIAAYVSEGPVVVTNADDITVAAMDNAAEWYKLLADLLYANMTLNGSVDIIGDGEGQLFEYVTDNIIWNGRQFFGHLFIIPVTQEIIQGVSS